MARLLSLDAVHLSHWRGAHETVVLDGVSLSVGAGEFLAVWGQRGAGKTTLAMVAAGLVQPQRGSVWFESEDLALAQRGRAPHLHLGIGWVQRTGPQSGDFESVLDYVALPLLGRHSPRAARRLANSMLGRLQVSGCAGDRWSSLTDGERTLVALAHALVREPRLLLADDPTANLNMLEREQVSGVLRSCRRRAGTGRAHDGARHARAGPPTASPR